MTTRKSEKPRNTSYRFEQLTIQYGPGTLEQGRGKAKWWNLSFQDVVDFFSQIRSVTINLLFFGALLVLFIVVRSELQAKRFLIGPIHIPETLKSEGYSEDVIASRLLDAISAIQTATTSIKDRTQISPASAKIDIVVPEVGVSLQSITQFVRSFLGKFDTTITGELTCSPPTPMPGDSIKAEASQTIPIDLKQECRREWLTMTLRISSSPQPINIGAMEGKSEQEYFAAEAEEVLNVIDPYSVASSYYANNPDKALALGEKLILENHQDKKWAFILLGKIYDERQNTSLAIAAYRASIDLDSKFALAHNNLGIALAHGGDVEGAIAEYRKAIALDAKYATPHYNLARRLASNGDVGGAIVEYKKAIDLNPKSSAARSLAEILLGARRYSEALPFALKAADSEANQTDQIFSLAKAAEGGSDSQSAETAAEQYLLRAPEGAYANEAKELIERLSKNAAAGSKPSASQ